MAQSRDQAMDVLHGAIEGALDAGMTPSDIELMAATIHRSRNQAAEYVGDLEAEVADLERCPDHPEDRLRRRTKLRSLLRIAEPVGDEVFYCVGDSGPCSWVHSRQVGTFIASGSSPHTLDEILEAYKQARAQLG